MPTNPTKNSKTTSRNVQTPPPPNPEQAKIQKKAEALRRVTKTASTKKPNARKPKKTTRDTYEVDKGKFKQWKDPKDRPATPEDMKLNIPVICGAIRSKRFAADPDNPGVCTQKAGWGTDHVGFGRCRFHGGNAKNGKIAAEREKVAAELIAQEAKMDALYGNPVEIDPHTALAQEVQRSAGHVAWLGQKVRDLEDESELTQTSMAGVTMSIWLQIYMNERDRLVTVSKIAIAAGVAERTVRLAEDQGRMIAVVIRDILMDKELELTPQQRETAKAVVRRHLIALDDPNVREAIATKELTTPRSAQTA